MTLSARSPSGKTPRIVIGTSMVTPERIDKGRAATTVRPGVCWKVALRMTTSLADTLRIVSVCCRSSAESQAVIVARSMPVDAVGRTVPRTPATGRM